MPDETGIVIHDLNTGDERRITSSSGAPVWSPTENVVAWSNEDGLFSLDLDTGATRQLADDAIAGIPAWSPDGLSLAYVDATDQVLRVIDTTRGMAIHAVPLAVGEATSYAPYVQALGSPSWSPDGSRIAFSCWDGLADEICILESNSGAVRQLTRIGGDATTSDSVAARQTAAGLGPGVWSADGAKLAAAAYAEQRGGPNGVFVIDPVRGTAKKVSELSPNSPLAWTPNGDALIFSANRKGRNDVFRVPVDGGDPVAVTASLSAGAREAALSPDASRMAVESDGQIVVIDLTQDEMEIVRFGPVAGGWPPPAWNKGGDLVAFLAEPNQIISYP